LKRSKSGKTWTVRPLSFSNPTNLLDFTPVHVSTKACSRCLLAMNHDKRGVLHGFILVIVAAAALRDMRASKNMQA
jgi:hypothetical protein